MARVDDVRKISIPKYFDEIIVPRMGSYYDLYPVDFSSKPVVCCPLHDEDTPSMRYYEETNSFYCFGCRNGGDIIQLHRKFIERQSGTKPRFQEAVDFLYKYFIEGKQSTDLKVKPYKSLIKHEIENDKSKLIKFEMYFKELSNQLFMDKTIPDDKKAQLYKILDDCDIMIELNKIKVDDAIAEIRESVNKVLNGD